MSEDRWKFQVSFKFGASGHLLNVRADDLVELTEALRGISSNAPEIVAAGAAFVPQVPPAQSTTPVYTPATAPVAAPVTPSPEMKGFVEKVDVQSGVGKTGKPYTKFVVHVGGAKTGTFDGLLGKVAQTLVGKEAWFAAEKGNYGYDLKSIRPA